MPYGLTRREKNRFEAAVQAYLIKIRNYKGPDKYPNDFQLKLDEVNHNEAAIKARNEELAQRQKEL